MSQAQGQALPPASRPCGSCPYRCDVPSGVWHPEEYAKLARYDGETFTQPPNLFACHQGLINGADQRLCAGWVAVHDMEESLSVRIAARSGQLDPEVVEELLDYTTPVALFASGAEAAAHGMAEVAAPGPEARRAIAKVAVKVAQRT